jgi:hypothetical protein
MPFPGLGDRGVLRAPDTVLRRAALEDGMSIDRATLESWSIARDYARNQEQLLTLGRAVYQTLRYRGGAIPDRGVIRDGRVQKHLRQQEAREPRLISRLRRGVGAIHAAN